MVNCFPGEINQTILNMIVNSAHAIEAKTAGEDKGNITITTTAEEGQVVIEIADDGIGMDESVRNRVFEHFFTTKEVGKGTGQGLSIAYSVIVEKHSGSLVVDSHPEMAAVLPSRCRLTDERALCGRLPGGITMKNILFVDDEVNVLNGLRRMLA